MEKENFIEKLSNMSLEEINKFILEKGKSPKIIPGIIFDDYNRKIIIGQYNK